MRRKIELLHPLHHVPATAVATKYYVVSGRNAGLVLAFPDGHHASLTYEEIRNLRIEKENDRDEIKQPATN